MHSLKFGSDLQGVPICFSPGLALTPPSQGVSMAKYIEEIVGALKQGSFG